MFECKLAEVFVDADTLCEVEILVEIIVGNTDDKVVVIFISMCDELAENTEETVVLDIVVFEKLLVVETVGTTEEVLPPPNEENIEIVCMECECDDVMNEGVMVGTADVLLMLNKMDEDDSGRTDEEFTCTLLLVKFTLRLTIEEVGERKMDVFWITVGEISAVEGVM